MTNQPLLLAIDQGTTSSRAMVFDRAGRPVAVSQQAFGQHYPQDGWVEHDPEEIWQTTLATCRDVLARTDADSIAAIGIANQRETTVVWERQSGKPIYKRHRVAGPAHRGPMRGIQPRRAGSTSQQKDRVIGGCLFFRPQDRLDSGPRGRRAAKSRSGGFWRSAPSTVF